MKILLFGKNGQVGWELNRSLQPLGEIIAPGREEADFSNLEDLRKTVQATKPDVIVNAAAYTAVDKAEEEPELAMQINGIAPGIIAEEAKNINALLVHYSTDYVFDGTKKIPYIETDTPNPINVYGSTKLAGELAIESSGCEYLIFRISWVYSLRSHNFLLTILELAKEREELSIVADQIGSPTSARLIAETTSHCISQVMQERRSGDFLPNLYHLASAGYTNWHDFASNVIHIANNKLGIKLKIKDIKKISSDEYQTRARRPMNSRLETDRLCKDFKIRLPHWKSALEDCMEELNCCH